MTKPKLEFWIARLQDGPHIGELTVVLLTSENGEEETPVVYELHPVSPFCGLDFGATPQHLKLGGVDPEQAQSAWFQDLSDKPGIVRYRAVKHELKLERKIDLHEVLTTHGDDAVKQELGYLRACLLSIAEAVGYKRDGDDAFWPEGVEAAVNDLVKRQRAPVLGFDPPAIERAPDANYVRGLERALARKHADMEAEIAALTAARDINASRIAELQEEAFEGRDYRAAVEQILTELDRNRGLVLDRASIDNIVRWARKKKE